MRNKYILPILVLASAVITACTMQPEKNAALDDARSSYSVARSSPDVTNLAPVELQQAGKALDVANEAQIKREDREVVDHLAYLAKQRVAIAQETAKLKAASLAVGNATAERDKVRLEVRTAEADAAKQNAANAREVGRQQAAAAADQAATALAASKANAERGRASLDAQTAKADAAEQQAAIARQNTSQRTAELAAANARVSKMESELKELNAKKTERGMVITLGDILFDTNKAVLKEGGIDNVQKLAEFFKEYPERNALIEGFTDSTGSNSLNQDLSVRRANAVRDTLMRLGVGGERIRTLGHGEENPVASNDTATGRQLNRRVEIVIPEDNGGGMPR